VTSSTSPALPTLSPLPQQRPQSQSPFLSSPQRSRPSHRCSWPQMLCPRTCRRLRN
ncbi:hypothetical protein HK405_011055, partial [Cladochytrium tenue]